MLQKTTKYVYDLDENHNNLNSSDDEVPLDLSVITNYMGINLCSVKNMTWERQEDAQLVSLTINFIPAEVREINPDTGDTKEYEMAKRPVK